MPSEAKPTPPGPRRPRGRSLLLGAALAALALVLAALVLQRFGADEETALLGDGPSAIADPELYATGVRDCLEDAPTMTASKATSVRVADSVPPAAVSVHRYEGGDPEERLADLAFYASAEEAKRAYSASAFDSWLEPELDNAIIYLWRQEATELERAAIRACARDPRGG
jgi:hypothetical protein